MLRSMLCKPVTACFLAYSILVLGFDNALAEQPGAAEDRLSELMRAENLSQDEVEARFFEVFTFEGTDIVRPFQSNLEFLGYSAHEIDQESLRAFKDVLRIYADSINAEATFREITVDDLGSIAADNPLRQYIMFEPLETFPTLKTRSDGLLTQDPIYYLPRDKDGQLLINFPSSQIRAIQEGGDEYRLTCIQPAYHRSGVIVHSFLFLDVSMPAESQTRCMWLAVLSAAGFVDPEARGADATAEYLAVGPIGPTPLDVAAIFLAQSLELKEATQRNQVATQIEQIWESQI